MSNTEYTEHQIQKFVSNEMKHTPGADEDILRFIADILYHCGAGNVETKSIQMLFRSGYCYYFAVMLQDAFPGGTICWPLHLDILFISMMISRMTLKVCIPEKLIVLSRLTG